MLALYCWSSEILIVSDPLLFPVCVLFPVVVCVCLQGSGPLGHGSGQHQLSECEVLPQAKASLPVGINLTLPPTYIRAHKEKCTRECTHPPLAFKENRVSTEAVKHIYPLWATPGLSLAWSSALLNWLPSCTSTECTHPLKRLKDNTANTA